MNNKFKRLLSILLSICLVFSLATVYTSAEETVDEVKTGNYYVRSNGYDVDDSAETTVNGDGRTANTPAPTVAAVIDTIIADGFNANDTANVYILQDEDGATKFSGTATSNNYAKHNMTAWSDTGTTPTAWTFTLVVKSPEDEQNYLAFSSYVGYAANMYINGPTVIENVTLIATRTYTDRRIVTNGYNVTLSDTTKFRAIDKKDASAGLTWDGTIKGWYIPVQISGTKGAEFSSPMTITLNNVYSNSGGTARRLGLHLPSGEGVANTFKEDVNIIIDNESATWPITFGGNTSSTSGKFEKTLNVNIKAAAAITESNGESNNGATGSITVTEGLQIIYPSATTVPDFAATLKTKGVENYWILENTTANEDLLTFATDENGDVVAGTYNVANGYAVTATGTNGTYTSSGSVLKIENPGTYTLTATASKDYYVRSTGYEKDNTTAGDGRSANSPAATVADVIATIDEDGLGAGDVANVYILQDSDGATAFDSTKASTYAYNSTTNILKHNMTAWSDVGNTTTTHDFTLVVKSPAGENNYLTFSSYMGINRNMYLGGPTVFENVTLTAVRNVQDDRLITNGYDVIFGEDTKFAFIKTGSAAVTSVSLNNNGPEGITITNTKDSTFTEDVNITFNNPYDYAASTYDRKTGLHLPSSGSVT